MTPCHDIDYVLRKLDWMRIEQIWPNGLRYLWTDAFGAVLLASLYRELGDRRYLEQAEELVTDVYRVLGRERGLPIGEADDRDGQYFHYLAMWMYALAVMAEFNSKYRDMGVELAKQVHRHFVVPGHGVLWKMKEDLSAPYPGYGFGALDALDGYDNDAITHVMACTSHFPGLMIGSNVTAADRSDRSKCNQRSADQERRGAEGTTADQSTF